MPNAKKIKCQHEGAAPSPGALLAAILPHGKPLGNLLELAMAQDGDASMMDVDGGDDAADVDNNEESGDEEDGDDGG